jgi:hypothetical protein
MLLGPLMGQNPMSDLSVTVSFHHSGQLRPVFSLLLLLLLLLLTDSRNNDCSSDGCL